jgi:seryl-tRNA synthetase
MTVAEKETMSVNQLINERADIKGQMDQLNRELKELRAESDYLDVLLLKKMDAEGVSRTANDAASVSINEDTVPNVDDWDELYTHVTATGDFSLLQRRVSSTAYKEMLKMGEAVPGLSPRTVRRVNFRKL